MCPQRDRTFRRVVARIIQPRADPRAVTNRSGIDAIRPTIGTKRRPVDPERRGIRTRAERDAVVVPGAGILAQRHAAVAAGKGIAPQRHAVRRERCGAVADRDRIDVARPVGRHIGVVAHCNRVVRLTLSARAQRNPTDTSRGGDRNAVAGAGRSGTHTAQRHAIGTAGQRIHAHCHGTGCRCPRAFAHRSRVVAGSTRVVPHCRAQRASRLGQTTDSSGPISKGLRVIAQCCALHAARGSAGADRSGQRI